MEDDDDIMPGAMMHHAGIGNRTVQEVILACVGAISKRHGPAAERGNQAHTTMVQFISGASPGMIRARTARRETRRGAPPFVRQGGRQ